MKKTIPALTSLRFFAAAMIVTTHTSGFFHIGEVLGKWLMMTQGVSFFFVLSGFVLFYSHRDMENGQGLTGCRFIWARVARIWPAHIVTMFAYWLVFNHLIGLQDPWSPGNTLANVLLLQAWVPYPNYYFGFNGVAWSLSVEMFLYAMFPLLVGNWSKTWHWKAAIAAVLVFVCTLTPVALDLPAWKPNYTGPTIASFTYIFPPAHLFEFVLGMCAASLYARHSNALAAVNVRIVNVLEVAAVAVAIWALFKVPAISWALAAQGYFDVGMRAWGTVSGASPFIAFLLFALGSGRGLVSKILAWRPLVLLGEISFSLYLVHQLFIKAWLNFPDFASGYSDLARYLGYWATILMVSFLLWRLVEKPAQRLLMGRWNKGAVMPKAEPQVVAQAQ